jgi:hypothetical protein
MKLIRSADRGLEFQKRSELVIRTHNETLSVAAMRIIQSEVMGNHR